MGFWKNVKIRKITALQKQKAIIEAEEVVMKSVFRANEGELMPIFYINKFVDLRKKIAAIDFDIAELQKQTTTS